MTDPLIAIGQAQFFHGLGPESRKQLAAIGIAREVKKREILFLEGDEGHSVYLLVRGCVQLHKSAPDGREVVIRIVQPGEVFAEVILFEQKSYPVTAVTLAESEVLLFPRRAIERLLEQADFRRDFMASLMGKLRYLTERILQLSTSDVEQRLLQFLADHAGGKPSFEVTLSKKDVAAAIQTTPETLSRVILRLTQSGALAWDGRRVTLRPDTHGRSGPPA
jgi:CRP/FNR family transcriptional regulator